MVPGEIKTTNCGGDARLIELHRAYVPVSLLPVQALKLKLGGTMDARMEIKLNDRGIALRWVLASFTSI